MILLKTPCRDYMRVIEQIKRVVEKLRTGTRNGIWLDRVYLQKMLAKEVHETLSYWICDELLKRRVYPSMIEQGWIVKEEKYQVYFRRRGHDDIIEDT